MAVNERYADKIKDPQSAEGREYWNRACNVAVAEAVREIEFAKQMQEWLRHQSELSMESLLAFAKAEARRELEERLHDEDDAKAKSVPGAPETALEDIHTMIGRQAAALLEISRAMGKALVDQILQLDLSELVGNTTTEQQSKLADTLAAVTEPRDMTPLLAQRVERYEGLKAPAERKQMARTEVAQENTGMMIKILGAFTEWRSECGLEPMSMLELKRRLFDKSQLANTILQANAEKRIEGVYSLMESICQLKDGVKAQEKIDMKPSSPGARR